MVAHPAIHLHLTDVTIPYPAAQLHHPNAHMHYQLTHAARNIAPLPDDITRLACRRLHPAHDNAHLAHATAHFAHPTSHSTRYHAHLHHPLQHRILPRGIAQQPAGNIINDRANVHSHPPAILFAQADKVDFPTPAPGYTSTLTLRHSN
ncbi:hypothetical protein SAMN05421788_112141 [Filimonas lacunae]|uniref:Uncharacterized protein n=1 Tax=Filimonas lacunae TaxID=477680 RepID=A0A1N7RE55_9BACT|nr:hypothetical protein [Filimonas lacunae]SIT33395.1 hypothetical protein SAMN05421788_112141 [Filimonas lacunae]